MIGSTREECESAFRQALALLKELGWIISEDKLVFPCQITEFLGITIDSVQRTLSIKVARVEVELERLDQLTAGSEITLQEVRKLAGRLNWLATVCPEGRPYIAGLYRSVAGHRHRRAVVHLDEEARQDTQWWRTTVAKSIEGGSDTWIRICEKGAFTLSRFLSDATPLWGLGIVWGGKVLTGAWTGQYMSADSTYLELLALVIGLKYLGQATSNQVLLFTTDNASAAFAINKGTAPDGRLRGLIKEIAQLASRHNCRILADHSPRARLAIPDALSRGVPYADIAQRALQFWA